MSKKAAALAAGAIAFVATAGPALAQGKTFPDVPADHWAAQAVQALSDKGIVIGYPDGTYGGPKAMTRYEFAMAVSRLLPLITQQITEAVNGVKPPDLSNYVTKTDLGNYVTQDQLQTALAPYAKSADVYTRAEADNLFATKAEIDRINGILNTMRDELTALGVDVNNLKRQYAILDARVTELEKLRVFGVGTVAWKTSQQYYGVSRGQVNAGVDYNGALLDNGAFINPTAPGGAVALQGQGKHGFFEDPSMFYDTQLGVQYSPSSRIRAVAQFILGNYWGAWQEQQAFNNGFGETFGVNGLGLLSNRQSASFALQPYVAYLSVPFKLPLAPNVVQGSGLSVGRIPTKLTPYTWWAVDPDTYLDVDREDNGNIPLTGAALNGTIKGATFALFGGYNPTDGTVPWTLASANDPTRNGLIGFGHYVRPGGAQVPGLGVVYPNTNRSHLLAFTPAGAAVPQGLYYDIPSVTSVAGVRAALPWLGVTYLIGTGDDWRTSAAANAAGATGLNVPSFNRTGQVYGFDLNTTVPVRKLVPSAPIVGYQAAVTQSKANNWGAFGVMTHGAGAHSNEGNAFDQKLTFGIGSANVFLGSKSISPGFDAPGYWGQLGSWVNPWNIVSDSPIYIVSGKGVHRWDVPLIPTQIGFGIPLTNVPLIGDLAFSLTDGVGHLHSDIGPGYLTPVGPTSGLAEVTDPNHFRITHSEAAVNFGAGQHSGWKFGLSSEDVLRDYPAGGSFKEDATFLWDALKNLVNVKGGSGSHQPHLLPSLIPGVAGSAQGPIQSDENYYRLSVAKNLTRDGTAFAKLTLSRIVYNDRSPANAASPGGGSYRGAVGTVQVTYKF